VTGGVDVQDLAAVPVHDLVELPADRDDVPLLVGPTVARPLGDGRAVEGGALVHVHQQPAVDVLDRVVRRRVDVRRTGRLLQRPAGLLDTEVRDESRVDASGAQVVLADPGDQVVVDGDVLDDLTGVLTAGDVGGL
jgi:hypothetical protein